MTTPSAVARTLLARAPLTAVVAVVALMLAAVATAQAPPSELDARRFGVVYDIPATRQVRLLSNLPYWKDSRDTLAIDVYLPPGLGKGEKRPAVVFLNAIGDRPGDSLKDWGIYSTWPRLVAAHGLVGISMEANGERIPECLRTLFAFLDSKGAPAAIDGQRIGVYAASANVTNAWEFLSQADAPRSVRAAALYYGSPPTDSLRADLPVLFVVAAGDAPNMTAQLDSLWHRVVATRAPWTLEFARGLPHGFDAFSDNDESRRVIQQTIAFWRSHLMPVPQPTWERSETRAIVATLYDHDAQASADALSRWLATHPNDANAHLQHGRALQQLGRFPEATAALERAYAIDSTEARVVAQLGGARLGEKRYEEAVRLFEKAIAMGWWTSLTLGQLAFAELSLNRNEQAVRHYEQAFEAGIPPGPASRGVASYNLACGYARLGRKDDALEALENALAEGGSVGSGMASDPDLESLRSDPRFRQLVARLPEAR